MHNFNLIPFTSMDNIAINGTITRDNNNFLTIHYQLSGDLDTIVIAPPSLSPTRKDELWQTTCFEFFIAIENSSNYWEINLSPSGDWNVYRFDNYRDGMQIENNIDNLPFTVNQNQDLLQLDIDFDLNTIITSEQKITVGITAVIENYDHTISYWALAHSGDQPDFHIKDSFVIDL